MVGSLRFSLYLGSVQFGCSISTSQCSKMSHSRFYKSLPGFLIEPGTKLIKKINAGASYSLPIHFLYILHISFYKLVIDIYTLLFSNVIQRFAFGHVRLRRKQVTPSSHRKSCPSYVPPLPSPVSPFFMMSAGLKFRY